MRKCGLETECGPWTFIVRWQGECRGSPSPHPPAFGWSPWPRHSAIGLMAFSPKIAPLARFYLRPVRSHQGEGEGEAGGLSVGVSLPLVGRGDRQSRWVGVPLAQLSERKVRRCTPHPSGASSLALTSFACPLPLGARGHGSRWLWLWLPASRGNDAGGLRAWLARVPWGARIW